MQLKPQTWKVINTDISEVNFVGCTKVQTKVEMMHKPLKMCKILNFLPKNAFISYTAMTVFIGKNLRSQLPHLRF